MTVTGGTQVKRTTRRLGGAVAAACGTLLLSACNAHPGQAAYVGDEAISSSTLEGVLSRSLTSECGKAYAQRPLALQRAKLADLINADLLQALAARLGVQVSAADVDAALRERSDTYGGQRVIELQASRAGAVPAADLPAAVRTQVLTDAVEDDLTRGVATPDDQLRAFYDAHQDQYLTGHLRDMVLTDKQTADSVAASLKANPGSFAAELRKQAQAQQAAGRKPDPQAVAELGPFVGLNPKSVVDAGGWIGLVPLAQLKSAGYPIDPGSVFTLQLANGWNVVQVVDRQSFDDVKQQVRRDMLAQQRQQALQRALADQLRRTPVHVNPRYGAWDSAKRTVVPASADVLAGGGGQQQAQLQCQGSQGQG